MKPHKSIIKHAVILAMMGLLFINPVIAQDWYNADWQYRREVVVDNPAGAELSDYQALIELDGSFNFSKANNDGNDIRITNSDGITKIPFWIENWDSFAEEASIWVKVPTIPVAGTNIFMYYGNSSPPAPAMIEVPPTGPWTKNPGNFLIPNGDPEGNGNHLLAENMVYDDETGHYWLIFANYRPSTKEICLAWSDDPGNINAWNWYSGNPIITAGNAPHILKHEGTWYIFYPDNSDFDNYPNVRWGISVSRSTTGITGPYDGTLHPNGYTGRDSILPPGPAGSWDWYRTDEPYVFQRDDGKWILVYMGDETGYWPGLGGVTEQNGYAIADDIMGPYTKFEGNPITAFGPPGLMDAGVIADPWVYQFEDTYYIGYVGGPDKSGNPAHTAYQTTTDWLTFTKHGIILPGSGIPGTWDEQRAFRGAVSRFGDTYYIIYTGYNASVYRMGIATQPAVIPEPINDPAEVFDFYDGFDGNKLNISKWIINYQNNGGTVEVNDGKLILTGISNGSSSGYVQVDGATSFGTEVLMEAKAEHPTKITPYTLDMAGELGFKNQDFSWDNFIRIMSGPDVTYYSMHSRDAGNGSGDLATSIELASYNPMDEHIYKVYRLADGTAEFQIDESVISSIDEAYVPTLDLHPWLMSWSNTNSPQSRFEVDWARVRKWAGAEAVVSVSNEEFLSQGIDIAVYNTSCGKFDVTLKPDVNISDNSISNIQFTIKWPANTVNLLNFSSNYGVELQGNFFIENDTNFAIFVSATPIPINWSAESEYTILSFAHDQLGTGTTDFIIDTSEWASLNNGSFYVELLGTDRTGMVYQNAPDVFLGTCGILDLKIFLQGPYDASSSLMNTAINGDLPLVQPYSDAPWNYPGTESVVSMPANAVDWVLVELRDAPDAASANFSTRYDRQAALILEDGTILSVDGSSIDFNNATLQNLFVVLWHRNHLGVLSAIELLASPVDFYSYDFSTDVSNAFLDGQIELNTNVFGMISGDANANNTVDLLDIIQIWNSQAGNDGYFNGDLNLDKQVNNIDKNDYWYFNLFKGSKVPE